MNALSASTRVQPSDAPLLPAPAEGGLGVDDAPFGI